MPMIRKLNLSALIILLSLISIAQLPKITFTPHWLPQAQFAGYYVAQQKGFYQQEGLDVNITHPSASVMATDQLSRGESDIISLFLITAISERQKGLDIVNIAQLSQNSALMFVAKKETNINTIEDLNEKKIGIWKSGFDEVPKSLIRSNNFNVTWVPILSSINMFMLGGIDAMTVMSYNEYDQIINSGMNPEELTTFHFTDYGYNIPEDGIYCLNETRLNRKEDLEKFVRGTLKGWEYAKTHKDEALKIVINVMKQAHIPTNIAHQSWMLDQIIELMEPGTKNIEKGKLASSDFHKTQSILIEGGYIQEKTQLKDFYKPVIED
jgi:NitT/TauT family transport system substrate-binding protein